MPTQTADAVVVGGGVIGLAAAWRLAQRGLRVTLLEAGGLGQGASGAALGALMPHCPTRRTPLTEIQLASLENFPDFVAEIEAATGLACGYRRVGRVEVLRSEKAVRRAAERIAAAGERWTAFGDAPLRRIGLLEARALVPGIADDALGYLHDTVSARIDPAGLLPALAAAARACGAELREATPVQRITLDGGGVAVDTPAGRIAAATAVICAGAGLAKLDLAPPVPVQPVKGQALMLEAEGTAAEMPLVLDVGAFAMAWDGRLGLGSTTEPDAPPGDYVTMQAFAELYRRAREMLPRLDLRAPRLWCGFRPATPDRQPVVGAHPASPRIIVAGGHYKIGLGLAPATADHVAALATGEASDPVWAALSPGRFAAAA